MTDIFFCDLCNESVPLADLDGGRAFRIKGRVVCSACNVAMSQPGGGVASATPAAGEPILSHGHAHAAATARGGGGAYAALTLAVLALGGVALVGAWTREEVVALRQQQRDELDGLRARVATLGTALEDQNAERARLEAAITGHVDEQLAALSQRLRIQDDELARLSREFRDGLEGVNSQAASISDALMRLERQDGELLTLSRRLNELQAAARETDEQLSAELRALRDAGASVVAPIPAEARPAWWPLVEQLRSDSVSERYAALVGLSGTRDPAAAPHVLPLLADPDIFLRMAAARTLGDLGSPESVGALIDTLEDGEGVVREAAYLSLRAITKRDLPFDAQSPDAAERSRRVKAWREWWEKERPKVGG